MRRPAQRIDQRAESRSDSTAEAVRNHASNSRSRRGAPSNGRPRPERQRRMATRSVAASASQTGGT